MLTTFNSHLKRKNGFTMIELLVVTTIMIMITAIGLVSYQNANRNARNAKRKADLTTVQSALVLYRSDNSTYPNQGDFTSMINFLNAQGYLNSTSFVDPKNEGNHQYVYDPGVGLTTFEIYTYLEPDPGLKFSLTNP